METYIVKKEEDKLYLFKGNEKIGEVSPQATWVKEGMEFLSEGDECEVFPLHIHHHKTEEIIYTDKYGAPLKKGKLPIFVIKCPNCKHFH